MRKNIEKRSNMITRCLFTLLALLATMSSVGQVSASQFFQECSEVLEKPEFVVLKRYLDSNLELPPPDKCFRINSNQFLVSVVDTGRIGQGLYYYDAKTKTYQLEGGRSRPGIVVFKEFMGPNNKRFVIFSVSNLSRGEWSQEYSILNLMPTKDGKSYIHYELVSWNEDPVTGLCGASKTNNKVSSIQKPQISNEGSESVQIVFPVTEQDCINSKITTYTRTFSLREGAFTEIKH